jgi:hypothetical protein
MLSRWIVRVVALVVLFGFLSWSWALFLDRDTPDGATWLIALIVAAAAWGAIESSVVAFGAPSPSLRHRLMLDGISARGTALAGILFLGVLIGAAYVGLALAGEPVQEPWFGLSTSALPWLQLAFGVAGAVVGVIFAVVAILPAALTIALLMERTRNTTEPRTRFSKMNMGELFGGAMVLASIGAALLGILLANVSSQDSAAGWYVLTGLSLVPLAIGWAINKISVSIRTSSESASQWDQYR